jgi:YVTN family beta-propeller protein
MKNLRHDVNFARPMQRIDVRRLHSFFIFVFAIFLLSGCKNPNSANSHAALPGVNIPGVRRSMDDIRPQATFPVEGKPDWMVVTDDAVWVASANVNHVVLLDPATNLPGAIVTIAEPCSGLAAGFGSIWVPSCGAHNLVRFDSQTGKIQAEIPASPAESEGGIAVGAGSVWMATDKKGVLARIDPETNRVIAEIVVPSGSYAPTFADGAIWITSTDHNLLTRVDTQTNQVITSISVGPKPRFLTVGAGSVWTLNQGDGTISRVDTRTSAVTATIAAGIPGAGGEIAFGEDSVWATMMQVPITRIDPQKNAVARQWFGKGGDSIRVGHGSVWLTDLFHGVVWRIDADQLKRGVPRWIIGIILAVVFVAYALLFWRRRMKSAVR